MYRWCKPPTYGMETTSPPEGGSTQRGVRLIVNGGTVTKSGADVTQIVTGAGADIQNGMLVLEAASAVDVDTKMKASYHAAAWDVGQFWSTTKDTTHGLGWVANTTTNKISIARTLYGDATLDGTVGLADLTKVQANWGTGTKWNQGDFNYDSAVGLADLTKVQANWGLLPNLC